jgi:hypothetical protein
MPISFNGPVFGNVTALVTYYVKTIASSTEFTISTMIGGTALTLTPGTGEMTLSADNPFITVSSSAGGSALALSTQIKETTATQYPLTTPTFNVRYVLGGYSVAIVSGGSGFAYDNNITIDGSDLGGASGTNDLTVNVSGISSTGVITSTISSGTPAGDVVQYYLKVISATQCEVYSDPLMQIPVSGIDFPYVGTTTTSATVIASNVITVGDSTIFSLNDPVIFTGSVFGGITLGTTYYVASKPSGTSVTVSTTIGGSAVTLSDSTGSMVIAKSGDYALLPEPFFFDQSIVKYNNQVWQCVISNNDSEFILGKWEILDSGNKKLNELDRIVGYYAPTVNMPGVDLTQLVNGIIYPNGTYLGNPFAPEDQYELNTILEDKPFGDVEDTVYNIQGEPFTTGYGPEELVPGVVTDNLAMIVTTRPGTDWDSDIYQNVGFNVVSTEVTPTAGQTVFSFSLIVENPANMALFNIDNATGLSTRIYNYSVDWVNKVITLGTALASNHNLRIDLYEVGNGDQLVKANSQIIPFVNNTSTGFVEMPLNCNYSASRFNGSGVIRPNTDPKQVTAIETDALDDGIVCSNVDYFSLNSPITFQGAVFGGIATGTQYYVKTISNITNKITVSTTINGGIAGPTFNVSSATGTMLVNIQSSNGLVWTDPIIVHNGTNLVLGEQGIVTETKSGTNTIVVNTTDHYEVDDTVVFSNAIDDTGSTFNGCGLASQQTYYITSIVGNEFTVSDTMGGADVTLNNATGIALCVTNDYAITIVDQGVTAKIVYANQYNQNNDFIVLSIFGETAPTQYGYTLPVLQQFTATAGQTIFNLSNYISGDNPNNAIVEKNGLRLNDTAYTIDDVTSTLTLTSGASLNDIIAVTSYNLTERQALNTQYGITGVTVSSIASISNQITDPLVTTNVTATTSGTNVLTCADTGSFITNQTIIFQGTSFGGVATDGTVYYVKSIVSPTTFTISSTLGGATFAVSTGSGNMITTVGGQPAVRVTTTSAHGLTAPTNSDQLARIAGTQGSVQLNNNTYYVHIISATQFDLYTAPYSSSLAAVNSPVTEISSWTGGGYVWEDETFVIVNDWDQVNVDRLWVTVNGYRVPSSSLYLNSNNNLSILVPISSGDVIIITSMMPTATPNQLTYIQTVDKNGEQSVFRANSLTRTWLTHGLQNIDTVMYVEDVSKITESITQYETAIVSGGICRIGLEGDKNSITQIIVYNNTTSTTIDPAEYSIVIENIAPILVIDSPDVTNGNSLTITVIIGNLVYVNGEQIRFTAVDFVANTISGLQRGSNGTGEQTYIPEYTEVYSMLSSNMLPNPYITQSWNSFNYNPVEGDPLQISTTYPANFLNADVP